LSGVHDNYVDEMAGGGGGDHEDFFYWGGKSVVSQGPLAGIFRGHGGGGGEKGGKGR